MHDTTRCRVGACGYRPGSSAFGSRTVVGTGGGCETAEAGRGAGLAGGGDDDGLAVGDAGALVCGTAPVVISSITCDSSTSIAPSESRMSPSSSSRTRR